MRSPFFIPSLAVAFHSSASVGTALPQDPVSSSSPAAIRFHPNGHGAHRPTANLSAADGLGFQVNLPYESILYYRGNRMGENGVPLNLDMDVRMSANLTWASDFKFINFIDDSSTDTKIHLWTALFYHVGGLSIGPSFKFHRNNNQPSSTRDAFDLGFQALYDFGPCKIGGGYSYDTESDGQFIEAGISAPIKLTSNLTLTPAAEVTYIDGWARPVKGMNNVSLRLTAAYKFNPMFTMAPFFAWNLPLEATKDRNDSEFIGGGALHFRF